jgi:hypothetical protein
MIFVLVLLGVGALLIARRPRQWLLEELKAVTDTLVVFFLRFSSQFGSELTEQGKAEQGMWREQRLRNLRGLALRSKQALSSRQSAVSSNKLAEDSRKETVS